MATTLSDKQERFCLEYLVDLNATAAARRAGYSKRTANEQAARLLANVSIQARVRELKAARAERTRLKADDVVRELALVAFSDIGEVVDFSRTDPRLRPADEIPETARRAVASMKVRRYTQGHGDDAREVEVTEFKLWDKLAALEKLGRHLGLFKDAGGPSGPQVSLQVIVGVDEDKMLGRTAHPPPALPAPDESDGTG